MKWLASIAMTLVLGIGLAGCSKAQSEQRSTAVATVAGKAISAETFRTKYVDYLLQSGLADTPRRRGAFLNRLISVKLIVHEAVAGGITEREAYRFYKETAHRKLLLETYAQEVLYDTLQVTQADLEAMFVRVNTQLTARHLYARTLPEAEALYARLQAGESFEALAQAVFEDTTLARQGGLVGTFGFDEMDPAFEDAAYALAVGATSEPVRTAQGYSIIRLEERFTKPMLSETEFAQRRDKLARYVRYRKQRAARTQHLRDLAAQAQVRVHEPALTQLLGQITGQALAPDAEAWPVWLNEPLVAFSDAAGTHHTWTVADFRERAQYTDARQRAQVQTRADLVDFIQGLIVREAMLARAEAEHWHQGAAFKHMLDEVLEEWVYEQAYNTLMAAMPSPEQDKQAYLQDHAATLRQTYTVHVYPDVLASVRLLTKASS